LNIMDTQYIQMTVICLLCFWTMGLAADLRCNDMYEKDGRCCRLCPPGSACTSTSNAHCSCGSGFLCSDHPCPYHCSREYTWKCVPCPNNTYSDTEQGHCKPLTQCGTQGLDVIFPGNKTHNSKCGIHGTLAITVKQFIGIRHLFGFISITSPDIHGCPLSKEESGGQLIQQAETKYNASQSLLSMASISTV
uniref:TNFR-Cys domain-containing protein n=1 Tax=Hucho hucho TaxID=62062 RepID=A0A4W5PRJ0_9TELE